MANEFIIKNGFHSKGDSQVTGSLGVSGSLQIQGIANVSASIAAAGGSTPTLQQVTTAGSSTSDQITTSNGINFSSDYITKLVSSTFKLNADAEDISTEIVGFGDNTNAKFNDTDLQLTGSTGGVKIKGPITGDDQFTLPKFNVSASILSFTNNAYKINANSQTGIIFNSDNRTISTLINGSDGLGCGLEVGNKTTIISGSLYVKQFGITSSAGLLLNDTTSGNTARANSTNIIQAPSTSPSSGAPGAPVIIKGGNSDGSGAKGGDLYLEGGIPSAGIGGNIYIAGGDGSSTSGSIFLKGNKINLDNTALEFYNNASNFYKLLNYNSSDQCAEIGIVSYSATGGNARDVKFFADGEEAFKITGGNSQKATLLGSRSGQHTEVRATSGSFSYLRGNSPLVIDTGTDTLKIAASNFNVTTAGEMSSGGSDGISTTNITASSDISSSGTITGNSFVKGGGTSTQFLKADGSVDSSTYSTATGVENNADVTDATNVAAAGALMASSNLSELNDPQTARDNLELGSMAVQTNTSVNIDGGSITGISELAVDGNISASGTITGNSFVKGGGTSAQFLKANGSVDSSTYSTATGVENNADVTPSWVPSVDPNYLTSVGTIDLTSGVTGILPVPNGGTGLDTLTSGYIPYGNGTSAFSNNSALLFNEGIKQLRITGDSTNDPLRLSNVQTSTDETKTALILASSDGGVQKATLGSNAFNSTAIPTNNNQLANGAGYVTGAFPFTGSGGISGSLEIIGSGSGIFSVEGSVGTLFSVDDGLDDVIFAANNVSGTPVISANADNTVKLGKLGGFGIVISGSTPAPNDSQAKIIITGSIHTSGSLGVGMAASSTIGRIDAKNDVVAFSTSDERLKDNITPIENALNKISQVQGIEFNWIEKEGVHGNKGHDVGVIAQEIEKVLPEVVTTRDNGYKAVKYEKIIPLLVEAIKELQAEVQELKKSK